MVYISNSICELKFNVMGFYCEEGDYQVNEMNGVLVVFFMQDKYGILKKMYFDLMFWLIFLVQVLDNMQCFENFKMFLKDLNISNIIMDFVKFIIFKKGVMVQLCKDNIVWYC